MCRNEMFNGLTSSLDSRMETPVFAVIGHGNEEPVEFNERPRVPPGTTVVLLTKPGQPFSADNAGYLWKAMVASPNLFENPVENKGEIERLPALEGDDPVKLRIYEAGALMPAMRISPQSYFPSRTYDRNYMNPSKMMIGGIYKFPLPFPTLSAKSKLYLARNSFVDINELYSGDANRQIRDDIQTRFGESPKVGQLTDESLFNYKIEEIIAMNGPGVYYFFNCRYVKGLQRKLDNFLGRLLPDITRERDAILAEMPEPPDTRNHREQRQRWFNYFYQINIRFSGFKNILTELIQAGSMLPEDKLMWLRNILLEGTLAEGNDKLKGREPVSANNIQSFLTRLKRLEGREDGLTLTPDTLDYVLAPLKRRYLALYDEEFGPLFRRLPITRQKSSAGQERYAGGTRKRRGKGRKTRRRNLS